MKPLRVRRPLALRCIHYSLDRLVALLVLLTANAASAATFTNSAAITVNDRVNASPPAPASPYPSNITVSGLAGAVTSVTVTLNNFSLVRPRDTDVLLVAPSGQAFIIMADCGGLTAINGVTITLSDAAASNLSDAAITSGTYKPTNIFFAGATEPDSFPAPAPASGLQTPAPTGSATFASTFNGINPNGTWSLYVVDDSLGGTPPGSIAGGWTLNVTTVVAAAPTATAVSSSPNPSFSTQSVAFTATVSSGSGTPTGNVTFTEGGTTLACGTVPLNGSGQAICNMAAGSLSEGSHTITATYNPSGSFSTSNGSTTHVVNNPTTVVGSQYCNTGAVTTNDNTSTTPYPSNIFVNGLSGTITKVTLTLKNWTIPRPRDIDVLLVGPGNRKFIPMSDVADITQANSITLVLEDSAGSGMPSGTGSVLAGGTFRPTDVNPGVVDTFPAPAPAAPYNSAAPNGAETFASTYNGISPNGTWSLYVVDDSLGGGNSSIAGGWCLTFATTATETATTTTVTSSANPSSTGSAVTFTATVRNASTSALVTNGTVTFRNGATTLASNVALTGGGTASFNTSALTEGAHVITAEYNGVPGSLAASNGNVTQQVINQTQSSGNCVDGFIFGNTLSGITINDAGPTPVGATPYPSRIVVSGLPSEIKAVRVVLTGLNHPRPDDLDILLVGPTGANIMLMSDTGGLAAPASNVTLVFDDAAASGLPDNSNIVTGTYRPTNFGASDTMPAPAPLPSANTMLSVFNNTNGNGTWSLYVVDDGASGSGTITGGWQLQFVTGCPPSFTSAASTRFTVGQSGSFNVTATGSPQPTIALTGGTLPGGVTFSAANVLGGTPAAGSHGTWPLTFTASNGALPNATQNFSLIVNPDAATVSKSGRISRQSASSWSVGFIGSPGDTYTIQYRNDLIAGSWQTLGTAIAGPSGAITFVDNPPAGTVKRFYRAIIP